MRHGQLRIAIDCSHHAIPGGIRTHIANLVHALAVVAPEHEYLFFSRMLTAPSSPLPVLPEGTRGRIIFARAPRRFVAFLENRLGWPPVEYWTGPIDIFHGIHFSLPVARAARLVLTVHDVAYLRHPEFYAEKKWNEYGYRYLLGHSIARAQAIIAISRTTKRDLVELCGVDPDRIWVIASGVDPRFRRLSEEEREPALRDLGIDRPFVIYPVGTIDLRKNLERTLDAFARAFPAPADRPLLVLTGVGNLPAPLQALAEKRGLAAHVLTLHVGSLTTLAVLLSAARWGMYLSLYEGFGQPPLEAMACGLPLVVSNVSSIPEVAGDAALSVDPCDIDAIAAAMRRLENDDSLRAELSARGLKRATSPAFSWERTARQVMAVYRDDPQAYRAEPQPLA
jgi:glycosyltransferase involved in cell wall biosynthesis